MPTVLTIGSKQKRMLEFYNSIKQHNLVYLGVGYDTGWTNNPPVPLETDNMPFSENCTMLGFQTYKEILFARVILDPTEEQKETAVYYKDCYYETISDSTQAIEEGYSRIMLRFVLDKDEYFPVTDEEGNAVMFNVLGMWTGVDPADLSDTYFISVQDFNALENSGLLELISTRSIISRSLDQNEDITILLEF